MELTTGGLTPPPLLRRSFDFSRLSPGSAQDDIHFFVYSIINDLSLTNGCHSEASVILTETAMLIAPCWNSKKQCGGLKNLPEYWNERLKENKISFEGRSSSVRRWDFAKSIPLYPPFLRGNVYDLWNCTFMLTNTCHSEALVLSTEYSCR